MRAALFLLILTLAAAASTQAAGAAMWRGGDSEHGATLDYDLRSVSAEASAAPNPGYADAGSDRAGAPPADAPHLAYALAGDSGKPGFDRGGDPGSAADSGCRPRRTSTRDDCRHRPEPGRCRGEAAGTGEIGCIGGAGVFTGSAHGSGTRAAASGRGLSDAARLPLIALSFAETNGEWRKSHWR
jgi:hypothetical protein